MPSCFHMFVRRLFPILGFGLSACTLSAAFVVDEITSLEASPSFTERHHTLHKLRVGELEAGATQLIDFMRVQQVPQGMRPVDYMSLVNDSFNLLVAHDLRAEELLLLTLEVIPDAAADEVWRDYAVQKLGYTLDRNDISEGSRDAGFAMLERAANGEFPRVQGTALVVAVKLGAEFDERYSFLKKERLGQLALACAQDEDALLMERVTALQVAARCGSPEALNYSRSILLRGNTSASQTMLFVSAIAVLGERGTSKDLAALDAHRLSPDVRIRSASMSAIRKIKQTL